jgi:glucokinase
LAEGKFFDSKDICAIYVGTGLGLGVLSSSLLISGFESMATELGHIPYKVAPFKCGCGKSNCIELFASGSAIEKWKEYYNLDKSLTIKELRNTQIYDEFIEALLHATGTAISLFNPEILVFGGGVMNNNKDIIEIVIARIHEYALPIALKNIQIKNTTIDNASLEGAFLLKDYNV